jgi:hypothetical protein
MVTASPALLSRDIWDDDSETKVRTSHTACRPANCGIVARVAQGQCRKGRCELPGRHAGMLEGSQSPANRVDLQGASDTDNPL